MTDPVDHGLAALRAEMAQVHPPAALDDALAARFRRDAARPRLWWMPPLALAAAIALATWMIRASHTTADPIVIERTPVQADAQPFLALRPMERLSLDGAPTVVATEFPRALLADWGLPVAPERAGELVRAEMLYSADGEPIAVRLIQ